MHTRQIAYFLAVFEHGGFGRAAAALQIAQPYAREAARAGAVVRRLDPAVSCDYALIHRDVPLSPAAREFVRLLPDEVTDASAESLTQSEE